MADNDARVGVQLVWENLPEFVRQGIDARVAVEGRGAPRNPLNPEQSQDGSSLLQGTTGTYQLAGGRYGPGGPPPDLVHPGVSPGGGATPGPGGGGGTFSIQRVESIQIINAGTVSVTGGGTGGGPGGLGGGGGGGGEARRFVDPEFQGGGIVERLMRGPEHLSREVAERIARDTGMLGAGPTIAGGAPPGGFSTPPPGSPGFVGPMLPPMPGGAFAGPGLYGQPYQMPSAGFQGSYAPFGGPNPLAGPQPTPILPGSAEAFRMAAYESQARAAYRQQALTMPGPMQPFEEWMEAYQPASSPARATSPLGQVLTGQGGFGLAYGVQTAAYHINQAFAAARAPSSEERIGGGLGALGGAAMGVAGVLAATGVGLPVVAGVAGIGALVNVLGGAISTQGAVAGREGALLREVTFGAEGWNTPDRPDTFYRQARNSNIGVENYLRIYGAVNRFGMGDRALLDRQVRALGQGLTPDEARVVAEQYGRGTDLFVTPGMDVGEQTGIMRGLAPNDQMIGQVVSRAAAQGDISSLVQARAMIQRVSPGMLPQLDDAMRNALQARNVQFKAQVDLSNQQSLFALGRGEEALTGRIATVDAQLAVARTGGQLNAPEVARLEAERTQALVQLTQFRFSEERGFGETAIAGTQRVQQEAMLTGNRGGVFQAIGARGGVQLQQAGILERQAADPTSGLTEAQRAQMREQAAGMRMQATILNRREQIDTAFQMDTAIGGGRAGAAQAALQGENLTQLYSPADQGRLFATIRDGIQLQLTAAQTRLAGLMHEGAGEWETAPIRAQIESLRSQIRQSVVQEFQQAYADAARPAEAAGRIAGAGLSTIQTLGQMPGPEMTALLGMRAGSIQALAGVAQQEYSDAVRMFGPNSRQAIEASERLAQAQANLRVEPLRQLDIRFAPVRAEAGAAEGLAGAATQGALLLGQGGMTTFGTRQRDVEAAGRQARIEEDYLTQLRQTPGVGEALIRQQQLRVGESRNREQQLRNSMGTFDMPVERRERMSQLQYEFDVLQSVPGAFGNIRATGIGLMGEVGGNIAMMQRQLQALPPGEQGDVARFQLNEQIRAAGRQQMGMFQQLSWGWQGRLISETLGTPGNFGLIASRFSLRDAVGAGVENPMFGSTAGNLGNYMRFASLVRQPGRLPGQAGASPSDDFGVFGMPGMPGVRDWGGQMGNQPHPATIPPGTIPDARGGYWRHGGPHGGDVYVPPGGGGGGVTGGAGMAGHGPAASFGVYGFPGAHGGTAAGPAVRVSGKVDVTVRLPGGAVVGTGTADLNPATGDSTPKQNKGPTGSGADDVRNLLAGSGVGYGQNY